MMRWAALALLLASCSPRPVAPATPAFAQRIVPRVPGPVLTELRNAQAAAQNQVADPTTSNARLLRIMELSGVASNAARIARARPTPAHIKAARAATAALRDFLATH